MNLLISFHILLIIQFQGWDVFASATFQWEYNEELGAQIQMPWFPGKLKDMEGKEMTLTGYYLPFELDDNQAIISKQPYASCFFCGGEGGPETVAEIHFKDEVGRIEPDDVITVRGKLHLNSDDFDHMVFMILDAELVEE
jgi:hypothetical protein